jgi:protein N-terminal methyltransferase
MLIFIATPPTRSCTRADTGAGVGRVSEELLLHFFGTVDVLEPSGHLLDKARAALAHPSQFGAPAGHAAADFLQQGLETWHPAPGRYDCVWVQWCFLYLTDDDVVALLKRAVAGLKPRGMIVVKENVCQEGFVVDRDDSSLTRSAAYLQGLFSRAGVAVAYNVRQRGMPAELFEVRMFVLKPRPAAS